MEEAPAESKVRMPCCGKAGSSVQFCLSCIRALASLGLDGRLGRCPSCSKLFTFEGGAVVSSQHQATCRMCQQTKVIADAQYMLCELCVLGSRFCFRYECDSCHRTQRIPHPMWRYQNTTSQFGTATWACHQRCGTYTHWRVLAEDASRIPAEHCPVGWGRREEWLAEVRAHLHNNNRNNRSNSGQQPQPQQEDGLAGQQREQAGEQQQDEQAGQQQDGQARGYCTTM
eukprot:gb/GEZN01011489.1/.p1 GENE.gb/GEZN01011489.1/~~gb/GEZN01011489.1/.p1  ORF type:complete len:260 (-),score=52.13 gb/GEZN01011489.1/:374-1057(-)